jgi:hypothetical protein
MVRIQLDGTKDGEPANANLGPNGWGFFLKLEQELTADGRLIGIVRYGRRFNEDATLVVGQFPSLLNPDQGIPADKLQVQESSPTNYTFDPFGYQGVVVG